MWATAGCVVIPDQKANCGDGFTTPLDVLTNQDPSQHWPPPASTYKPRRRNRSECRLDRTLEDLERLALFSLELPCLNATSFCWGNPGADVSRVDLGFPHSGSYRDHQGCD